MSFVLKTRSHENYNKLYKQTEPKQTEPNRVEKNSTELS